jgi:hypothetical protein
MSGPTGASLWGSGLMNEEEREKPTLAQPRAVSLVRSGTAAAGAAAPAYKHTSAKHKKRCIKSAG